MKKTAVVVPCSKVTPADFFVAAFELSRICLYVPSPLFSQAYAARLKG